MFVLVPIKNIDVDRVKLELVTALIALGYTPIDQMNFSGPRTSCGVSIYPTFISLVDHRSSYAYEYQPTMEFLSGILSKLGNHWTITTEDGQVYNHTYSPVDYAPPQFLVYLKSFFALIHNKRLRSVVYTDVMGRSFDLTPQL